MANIYYKPITNKTTTKEIQKITQQLLDTIISKEKIKLEKNIPLKVHFGEKRNKTFVKSENYEGIIAYLKKKKIKTSYIETNVLYGGQRYRKDLHLKLAKEHGFTQLPIIISDGNEGEQFTEVEINKKHFKTCKIGKGFQDYKQVLVLSHFKGHAAAGFGGAIKQLGMGFASKGGKLAMHMGIKPHIIERKCKKCNLCKTRCNYNAITIDKKSTIDHNKCVGCSACVAACPHKAISIITTKGILKAIGIGNNFKEKLAEYAYAAQKNKNNIYINFAINITRGCDCEPRKMHPIMENIGIFISIDPLSIDKACYDIIKQKGHKFRGHAIFDYAEKIGLGSTQYKLIRI